MHIREISPEKPNTLVLLHGQVFDSTYWDVAVPSFDARLLLPDMPGHGLSSALPVTDFAAQQEELEAALLARVTQPVHLVAYSLGSYHALALALRAKLKVKTLTMLGPFAGADPAVLQAFANNAEILARGDVPLTDAFIGSCFSPEFAALHPATVALARAQIARGSVLTLIAELRRFPDMVDLRPRFAELKMPVLVRVGERDQSTPRVACEALARSLPGLKLEIAPMVAHHYLAQDLEGTVASIKRFTNC